VKIFKGLYVVQVYAEVNNNSVAQKIKSILHFSFYLLNLAIEGG